MGAPAPPFCAPSHCACWCRALVTRLERVASGLPAVLQAGISRPGHSLNPKPALNPTCWGHVAAVRPTCQDCGLCEDTNL